MPKIIVVGYDGGRAAEDALRVAINEAGVHGASVDILTSVSDHDDDEASAVHARELLELAGNRVANAGIPYRLHLLVKELGAGRDIVAVARRLDARFIVIGVSKRSKLGKLIFGSTAQYVILNSPCPVICVP